MIADHSEIDYRNILFSVGPRPLNDWDQNVENGYIKRLTDPDIKTQVLEICSGNAESTYITIPRESHEVLHMQLPIFSAVIKFLGKFFFIDITVLDDTKTKRTFKISDTITRAHVKNNISKIPMKLINGWNNVTINLSDFVKRAYGTNYVETLRVTLHANCRIRRAYFSNRVLNEDEIPSEYRLVPTGAVSPSETQ